MSFPKKIYDPVHGFIRFNEAESALIDTLPFQRLHYIRQLGIAYLVYPGATHTRFEHSLGVMELATQICDRIVSKFTKADEIGDKTYWKQIVRFAALCHDLGHLPFSHLAEQAILGKGGHEKWTLKVIRSAYLKPIWEKLSAAFPGRNAEEDVLKISIGEEKLSEIEPHPFSPWEKVFSQIITGDFFGADRIDYLLRDARCTGVSYGLFDYHQMIEMLCILPAKGKGEGGLELGIEENGIEACEALLLARHFMHQRVYQYPSVKSYSFHMQRFMSHFYAESSYLDDLERYLGVSDNEILSALQRAAKDPKHSAHEDAVSLCFRQYRYRALQYTRPLKEDDLIKIKKNLSLPEGAISWRLSKAEKSPMGLEFPVLKRSVGVTDASGLPQILIPSSSYSWVYIHPQFEKEVVRLLENI